MIMRSIQFICAAVALFSMVFAAGCAETRTNIKNDETIEKSGSAVILAINPSSDASQVEVLTDKPLSYTYYKTSEPPRIVLDLAQTEPGSLAGDTEVNSGNINRIEVSKHEFTGGFLSRVEIVLAKDEGDFSVNTDSVDKGKLIISFAGADNVPAIPEKSTDETVVLASQNGTAANVQDEKTTETVPTATEMQTADTDEAPVPPDILEQKKSSAVVPQNAPVITTDNNNASQVKVLRAVSTSDNGIDINVDGGIDTFNTFKLTKPERIVIDLAGVKSAIAAKSVKIGKFNINQVRQGLYPEKIRLVLDAEKDSLLPYHVDKVSDGLKVTFSDVHPATDTSARKETTSLPLTKTKSSLTKVSQIESIEFRVVDDFSQIAIKIGGNCIAGKPAKVEGGLSLAIRGCNLPDNLQRMIDTSGFPSVVKMVTPYQVKRSNRHDTRIVAKLRQATESAIRRDGDTLLWEFKNPDVVKTAVKEKTAASEGKADVAAAPAEHKVKANKIADVTSVQDKHSAPPLKHGEKKVYTGRRVSLEFSDADIRKILQLIAEVSNLNFLIGDDVSGTISIKLVNVPWDQALEVILESKGLEKKQEGNIMYIKPKGKFKTEEQEAAEEKLALERRMELKTRVFEVNFADGNDVTKKLFEKMRSERGTITFDERTNRIIVTDTEERLDKMGNILKELDIPEKQVMIEARIVEATSTFARDLGVQWGLHYRDADGEVLGMRQVDLGLGGIVTPPPTSGTFGIVGGNAAGISFGTLGSNVNVDLRLSAAATVGQVKIISSPKVITLNNKSAKISQGQSIPYQTVSAEGTKTEFVEAALTLEVTPHVANDGSISMKIKATNNSAGSGAPPPINKKEATTEVQIKSGETTVIGGIYTDTDTEEDTGMPFLKDIPLLGWLFKSNTVAKVKTELLIFITPRIVN